MAAHVQNETDVQKVQQQKQLHPLHHELHSFLVLHLGLQNPTIQTHSPFLSSFVDFDSDSDTDEGGDDGNRQEDVYDPNDYSEQGQRKMPMMRERQMCNNLYYFATTGTIL